MTGSKDNPGATGWSLNSRREVLTAALAGIGATLLSSSGRAAQPTLPLIATPGENNVAQVRSEVLHFDDPVAKLHAHLRLERTLAEESSTLTWYTWIVFMVPKVKAPVPIMRYEGIEYSILRHLGNNNFRLHAHNLSYPRDLHTGEFTDTVLNPVTGEMLSVGPSIITTDPGTVHNARGFRNVNGDGAYQERYAMFRIEDELLKLDSVRGAPAEKPVTHQENSCAWCNFDEFTNPNLNSLPQHFVGNYLYEYPRFLKMGDRPGHLSAMFDGKKIASIEELPNEFLDRTRREYPELLLPRWQDFDTPLAFKL
ncbi:MAG: hypothetical protein ACI87W_000635 [Halieaceae bacterium]|jgi:hypothetical protein